MHLNRVPHGRGDQGVVFHDPVSPDAECVPEAIWPQPFTSGLVFGHQLLPVGQTAQHGTQALAGHGWGQLELVPARYQAEGAVVDSHGLQPAGIGLFLDPAAGVVDLALRDAELGFAVVVGGPGDECHLPGADTKHPADLDHVGPAFGE